MLWFFVKKRLPYLLLALFFALLVIASIAGLIPCWFPEPVRASQMDGVTCDWLMPFWSKLQSLVIGAIGCLGVFSASRGSRRASLLLALLILTMVVLLIADMILVQTHFGLWSVSIFDLIAIAGFLLVAVSLFAYSNIDRSKQN